MISQSVGLIYTTLGDGFANTVADTDYTPVTGVVIQWDGKNFLQFDAITSRTHTGDTEVTEHPVEQGPDVTDHVRPKPYEIEVEAFISNTPIVGGTLQTQALNPAIYTPPLSLNPFADLALGLNALGSAIFGAPTYNAKIMTFATPFDNVSDTLAQLQAFHDDSTLLTLITSESTYDSCVMTHFALGKTPETGGGATCAMTFRVLTVVQTSSAAPPTPAIVRGAVPLNAGVQATSAAPPAVQSLLTEVSQYITGGSTFSL